MEVLSFIVVFAIGRGEKLAHCLSATGAIVKSIAKRPSSGEETYGD